MRRSTPVSLNTGVAWWLASSHCISGYDAGVVTARREVVGLYIFCGGVIGLLRMTSISCLSIRDNLTSIAYLVHSSILLF